MGKTTLISEMHIAAIDTEQDLKKKWLHYGFNSREECDRYLSYARSESCGYVAFQSVMKFMENGFGVKNTKELLQKYPIERFRETRGQRQ